MHPSCLSIYLWMDILDASSFWQLWIKVLKYLHAGFHVDMFSTQYLKDWLLDCMINLHLLLLKNSQTVFQNCFIFHSHLQWWGFLLFHILTSRYCQFFLSYIDSCVVVSHCLVCNSLVTCNVRYLFICIFTTFI